MLNGFQVTKDARRQRVDTTRLRVFKDIRRSEHGQHTQTRVQYTGTTSRVTVGEDVSVGEKSPGLLISLPPRYQRPSPLHGLQRATRHSATQSNTPEVIEIVRPLSPVVDDLYPIRGGARQEASPQGFSTASVTSSSTSTAPLRALHTPLNEDITLRADNVRRFSEAQTL